MPESARPDVDDQALSVGHRSIPADVPLNISKFSSGQEGASAQGHSSQVGPAGATCSAEVSEEGTGWGAFQIGYAFDNASSSSIRAVVRLKLASTSSSERASRSIDPNDIPTGALNLNFVLKDTLGVVLRQEVLYSGEIGNGAADAKRNHDLTFEASLEPGRGFYLVLSGRAETTCKPGQSAKVSLGVADVDLRIEWKHAPGVANSTAEPTPVAAEAVKP